MCNIENREPSTSFLHESAGTMADGGTLFYFWSAEADGWMDGWRSFAQMDTAPHRTGDTTASSAIRVSPL